MRVKLLSFDLDNTLWPVDVVILRAEKKLHEWYGQHYPRITELSIEQQRELRHQIGELYPDLAHDLTELRRRAIGMAAEMAGYDDAVIEPAFSVFMHWRNAVDLFPEALPMLNALRASYTLAALTNGNADIQTIGISEYFQHCLTAGEIGAAKPDPKMFETLLEISGRQAAEIVHIGDDLQADVMGAQAVGMRTIWFNPNDKDNDGINADATVTSLAQIPAALANMNAIGTDLPQEW